ncbi:DNA-binding MarR family transcriptional regulator [Sulfitobacter undariae]|uniref:DNA-binding MarR family transcriptional regulator n=1 Tax=Sulfitobacter undariae TaxID=1563671 RepID=A0A7W6E4Y2_9RHOB|nr:MarR family transcriptional regulator [Sulfitobacter undariae]MBB3994822.1 DNA-binding MarR family transcriptional regulator [Sulfitobacter undariae]
MATEVQDENLARQRLRLWLQMLKATRSVEAKLRNKLREEYDTTLPRFDVLAVLNANPDGMKMSDLSQHLVVSNGNVTGVVTRLVEDGLVKRTTIKEDRRAFLVQITPAGSKFASEIATAHMTWVDEIMSEVADTDAARGISIMLDVRLKK